MFSVLSPPPCPAPRVAAVPVIKRVAATVSEMVSQACFIDRPTGKSAGYRAYSYRP